MEVHDITLAGKKRGHHPWFALAASDHPSQQEEVRTVGEDQQWGFFIISEFKGFEMPHILVGATSVYLIPQVMSHN